jgi:hypothetical protein
MAGGDTIKMWANAVHATAPTTPNTTIQYISPVSQRTGTSRKLKPVCDDIWPKDQNIHKANTLATSKETHKSFSAMKGTYPDKRLNFMTSIGRSTLAHLALGIISQSENTGQHNDQRTSLDVPPLPARCTTIHQSASVCSGPRNPPINETMSKGDKNRNEERRRKENEERSSE